MAWVPTEVQENNPHVTGKTDLNPSYMGNISNSASATINPMITCILCTILDNVMGAICSQLLQRKNERLGKSIIPYSLQFGTNIC